LRFKEKAYATILELERRSVAGERAERREEDYTEYCVSYHHDLVFTEDIRNYMVLLGRIII
jgi:hypothetical protein